MKRALYHIIFLAIPFLVNAQVFFNETRSYCPEADLVLIPAVHFGYSIQHREFLAVNNGVEVESKFILPEVYVGGQLLANGFMISADWGILQKTIMIGAGLSIPLKVKKKKGKSLD